MKKRTIKFRAKSKQSRYDWVYGSLLVAYDFYGELSYQIVADQHIHYRAEYDTIGQFTGLHDINAKEIYQDDILECSDGVRCVVVWDADNHPYAAGFITRDADGLVGAYPLNLYWVEKKSPKVIGNIHDNPELLTKSK